MKILFVGNLVPEDYSVNIKMNSLAGNKFQNKVVKELKKNNECDILSFVAVPLNSENKQFIDSLNNQNDSYYYKDKTIIRSILQYRKKLKKIANNYDAIIVYNVAYPWLFLPKMSNRKNVLILADFSDRESYKGIMKIYSLLCKYDIRNYQYVVGLSKNTEKILKEKQKFLCMPGGIDISDYSKVTPTPVKNKISLMYSGNLSSITGIDLLIEAVKKMDRDDFELIITGRGELENYVNSANNDHRIKYYGSLPYEDYLILLNNANILINPRNMNIPENNNNFPSKVFDYLAVGKTVVSTKFIGYEEFRENFYFCDSNINSLTKCIENAIINYNDNYIKVFKTNIKKSYEYDWKNQIDKIITMIND